MKTKSKKPRSIGDYPKKYGELVQMFPPRPIHDKVDYDNTLEVIEPLAVAGDDLNADQAEYLELLTQLIETHDRAHHELPSSETPLQRLKDLLESSGTSTADLGRLVGSSSLASQIVLGRRQLSKTHVRKLADHFKLSTDYFL